MPEAREIYWTFGCGISVVIATAFATFGTFLDIHLVARAQLYCLGDLSVGENLSGTLFAVTRMVLFPVISVLSALLAVSFHLLGRLPWLAARIWPRPILLALTIAGSIAGPVAMAMYDLATEGTPGDCVLPWWPTWLPS
ncbi:hypothetical protein Sme01_36630 [Sphaerisporangium melleum]|nr:hypothetical protein Sme01_36630 [Sphaerisporangium melleum]